MAEAVLLSQETVSIAAQKVGVPVEDMQATFEDYKARGLNAYVVFDYYGPQGDYVGWSAMREMFFRNYFIFPWGENPNKFERVAAIETTLED